MITQVVGKVARVGVDWVEVDLGAVSVRVNVPTHTASSVGSPDSEVRLLTSLQVKEDSLTLYGFRDESARSGFEALLGISGVGPRLALSVLSILSPEDLAAAVASDDVSALSRVPGVGKKTAGRIVLELKGKLGASLEIASGGEGLAEVIEALTALGYSLGEARDAVTTLPPDSGASTEDRVRTALERLAAQ